MHEILQDLSDTQKLIPFENFDISNEIMSSFKAKISDTQKYSLRVLNEEEFRLKITLKSP